MTDTAALASELRLAVHRLSRRLRQQRPVDGLSLSQLSALATIYRSGPLSAGDVAAAEGVKPPSTTRVLAALEHRGLIERSVDPTDARQALISISELGRETIDRDVQMRDIWLARQLRDLAETDLDLLELAAPLLRALAEQ